MDFKKRMSWLSTQHHALRAEYSALSTTCEALREELRRAQMERDTARNDEAAKSAAMSASLASLRSAHEALRTKFDILHDAFVAPLPQLNNKEAQQHASAH